MKKLFLVILPILAVNYVSAQSIFPTDGSSAGVGTIAPSSYFHGGNNKVLEISNPNTLLNSQSHIILSTGSVLANSGAGTITWISKSSTSSQGMAYIGSVIQGDATNNASANITFATANNSTPIPRMALDQYGRLGIGTQTPQSQLHVFGIGQNTASLSTTGNMGGTLYLQDSGGSQNNGGTLLFGVYQGAFAAIKGLGYNGDGNTIGDLAFSNRNGIGDATLTERMRISYLGNVLIGKSTQQNTGYMLDVAGNVRANEIVVNTTGADFVFNKTYKLRSLSEVNNYVNLYRHLPEIPSAKDMQENGLNVSELNTKLLQKIEELTLYLIEKDKADAAQQMQISKISVAYSKKIKHLQQQLNQLKSAQNTVK